MIRREQIVQAAREVFAPLESHPALQDGNKLDYERVALMSCVLNRGYQGKSGDENMMIIPLTDDSPAAVRLKEIGELHHQGRHDEVDWEAEGGVPYAVILVFEPNESVGLPNGKPLLTLVTGWDSAHTEDSAGTFVRESTSCEWEPEGTVEYMTFKGSNGLYHFITTCIISENNS